MSTTGFESLHTVITGGTGALGSAVVQCLLEQGASCHVPCFHIHELEAFALKDHERVHVMPGIDLRSETQVTEYYAALPGLWASIHIAGGFDMAPVCETSLESFEAMWRMNVVTAFLCAREGVKSMRTRGTKARRHEGTEREAAGGRIVNVAARPALAPCGGMIAYTTAKSAVASMTGCLAEELKSEGILVNAVAPSIIDTPANRSAMPDADHESWPDPEAIADVIAQLASPGNALTSGAIVPVYGVA